MGRKTKLTRDFIDRAARLVERGHYAETVCAYLSIHPSTWYRWLDEGRAARTGPKREFCEAIARASALVEIEAVEAWRRSFTEDWRAIAMFLERRFPDRWGRRSKLGSDTEREGTTPDAAQEGACTACGRSDTTKEELLEFMNKVIPDLTEDQHGAFLGALSASVREEEKGNLETTGSATRLRARR